MDTFLRSVSWVNWVAIDRSPPRLCPGTCTPPPGVDPACRESAQVPHALRVEKLCPYLCPACLEKEPCLHPVCDLFDPLSANRTPIVTDAWIAERMKHIDASGIRKVFDLAQTMKDPINLSIGQPDFDVPMPVKAAASTPSDAGKNAVHRHAGHARAAGKNSKPRSTPSTAIADRQVLVTWGTAGGLLLAICAVVNPGDEVIIFDPYFVMYGTRRPWPAESRFYIDTYPDFRIEPDRSPPRSRRAPSASIVNTPANPTGVVATADEMRAWPTLAAERNVLLISDEVYRAFCYDAPFASPATWNEDVLVVDGFSKAYGMTGWRLGFAHGPARLIQEMTKLQQFSFVCAPSPFQYAGGRGPRRRPDQPIEAYRRKRDMVVAAPRATTSISLPRGCLLRLPERSLGHSQRVRGRGHRQQSLDHPRQRLQPPRHALPHFLRRLRRHAPARVRGAADAGGVAKEFGGNWIFGVRSAFSTSKGCLGQRRSMVSAVIAQPASLPGGMVIG